MNLSLSEITNFAKEIPDSLRGYLIGWIIISTFWYLDIALFHPAMFKSHPEYIIAMVSISIAACWYVSFIAISLFLFGGNKIIVDILSFAFSIFGVSLVIGINQFYRVPFEKTVCASHLTVGIILILSLIRFARKSMK